MWVSDWQVDVQYIETDLQQLQLRQRHEPRHLCEAIEEQYAQQAAQRPPKRPLHLDSTARPDSDSAAAAGSAEPTNLSRFKRRLAAVSMVACDLHGSLSWDLQYDRHNFSRMIDCSMLLDYSRTDSQGCLWLAHQTTHHALSKVVIGLMSKRVLVASVKGQK